MNTLKEATQKIIDKLKAKYKDDPEALEEIERRVKDIEYVERKEAAGDYDGQPSIGIAKSLERHLADWY